VSYQIVGEPEADLARGKISISSPIARSLMGKEEGDEVQVRSPKGNTAFEVLKIEYL
jgi:transcription elongation factor GreA